MKNKLSYPLVYLNKVNEDWIVDRTRREWYINNKDLSTNFLYKSNIVWLIAPWNWDNTSKRHLSKKKVLCSIYHIDEEKFGTKKKQ